MADAESRRREAARADLERLVGERTAELSEASNAFALSMQDLQALCA